MRIDDLISQRSVETEACWDVVYEWEDDLAASCGLRLSTPPLSPKGIAAKIVRRCPVLARLAPRPNGALLFELNTDHLPVYNNRRTVPWVIDFFLRTDGQLEKFYRDYSRNPCVLISSREAYEFLRAKGCPLPIGHLSLSLSDRHAVTAETRFEKQYDLALMGRSSPKLMRFLDEYVRRHPGFVYVLREWTADFRAIYRLSTGQVLNSADTRDEYLRIMRASRACFYSTPGMDVENNGRANGFNQVTPRFLEMMACGCHVLARYPQNQDTGYFGLAEMAPNVDSYEMFEQELDRCRREPVDMRKHAQYLKRHYTSVRAGELKRILEAL